MRGGNRSSRSLIYNRIGPNTDPCGTPEKGNIVLDTVLATLTDCLRFEMKDIYKNMRNNITKKMKIANDLILILSLYTSFGKYF